MVMQGIISITPLLLLIILGFSFATSPWYGKDGMAVMSKFTLDIAIPLYLFYTVVKTYSHPRELYELLCLLPYPFLLVGSSIAFSALAARLLSIKPPRRGVFINAASLSNTVVMGMPIAISVFGDEVTPITMVFYATNTIVYWSLGVWILRREVGAREKTGMVQIVKIILTTRPMMGFLLGILAVLLRVPFPDVVMTTLKCIGGTVMPLAMIFIGGVIRFAEFGKIRKLRELYIVIAYRMFMVPVLSAAVCQIMPIPVLMKQVFFILANMPAMAQLPIMAREVGSDYELASLATAVTTALSMGMVPVYISLMNYFHIPG